MRFYAFDQLWLNGRDMPGLPLLERKARLFDLVPDDDAQLLYVDHVEGDGVPFLKAASAMDLEGVVGKYAPGVYQSSAATSRVKVRNPNYSQMEGRADLFEGRSGPHSRPPASAGTGVASHNLRAYHPLPRQRGCPAP